MLEIAEPRAAIFLLDRNPVQAQRADFRPQIARKLVALVDLGGARRDLVTGEIMHGLANRVRGFAEIEIEHPMRVGNHGQAGSGIIMRWSRAQAYSLPASLSRADEAEKGHPPGSLPRVPRGETRPNK